MSDYIDCLLIGYSGFNKKSIEYKNLLEKNPEIGSIPTALNSAITYLGTALNEKGLTFDFINYIEDNTEALVHILNTKKVRSIGISTTICPSINQLTSLIDFIKNIDSGLPVVLGGAFIVHFVREMWGTSEAVFQSSLKNINGDFIIDSIYGEDKLADIVHRIKNQLDFSDIPNLFYRENAKLIRTSNLDESYKLEDKKINWQLFKRRTGNAVVVRTSISCCFSCRFCNFPVRAGKFKSLGLKHIEEELNEIEKLGEVRLVHFIDDTFNVPLERFKNILRMFIKNKYSFKWHCFIRCQDLDEAAVQMMKKSGCIGVFLGLESGSDKVLEVMNKASKVDEYRKGIDLLNKYEITIVASFFLGFPGETIDTAKETYKFIEEVKPTYYYLGPWFYEPNTPIGKYKDTYEIKGRFNNWSHKGMNSETANKLASQMKASIKNSILLEYIHYPFLFQVIDRIGFYP